MAKRQQGDRPEKVVAYGFEKLGFRIPNKDVIGPSFQIQWRAYEAPAPLDDAQGVIIPQGIFESLEWMPGIRSHTRVTCDEPLMLQREREVINLMGDGGWVCFLVGSVIDYPSDATRRADNSDLCKRLLNAFGVRRALLGSAVTWVHPLRDEFRPFIEKYGIAKTELGAPSRKDARVLATDGSQANLALELSTSLFVLPFHTTNTDAAREVVSLVAKAVVSY